MKELEEALAQVKLGKISLSEGVRRIRAARAFRASSSAPDEPRLFRVDQRPASTALQGLPASAPPVRVVTTGAAWDLFTRWRDGPGSAGSVEGTLSTTSEDPYTGAERLVVVDAFDARAEGGDELFAARARELFHLLLRAAQRAIARRAPRTIGFVGIHSGEIPPPHQAAVESLLRTFARELPAVRFRFLGWSAPDPREREEGFARALTLATEGELPAGWLRGGRLFCPELREAQVGESPPLAIEGGQVFLITGGAGRLGTTLAHALASEGVGLVLLGRAAPSEAIQSTLQQLAHRGARAQYVTCDMADPAAVRAACRTAIDAFGRIDGVFHLAGATADGLAATKDPARCDGVLGPKVTGTVALDDALRGQPLRFFVGFSSTSSVFGNVGQADYAFANGFLDAWTEWRRAQGASGVSLSVCWPLWQDGGMRPPEETATRWKEEFGLSPLPSAVGLRLLRAALASREQGRLVVLHGDPRRFSPLLAGELARPAAGAPEPRPALEPEAADLRASALDIAKKVLAAETRTPLERVDPQRPFGDYGLDSTMILQLTSQLEATFGALPKTLFYEYADLDELADHLAREYGPALRAKLSGAERAAPRKLRDLPVRPAQPERAAGVEDVAIIGLAGRYPASPDLGAFWTNLRNGLDCISEIPRSRWDLEQLGQAGKQIYCTWGGFLDGVDQFEPRLFNITPNDAKALDPQQRLFLEIVYELLEDAGYAREAIAGRSRSVGVFVGVMWGEYALVALDAARAQAIPTPRSQYWEIPNRISYFFDFRGPSLAIDSACSSSLTALHYAAESVRSGACEVAIAGGVNLSLHASKYQGLCDGHFASTHGRCKSFGHGGDGYVPGEGVGAVLLKPLRRALEDGDNVCAVVRGTAVNHGGRQHGFSVPSPTAQAELIARALEHARVSPEEIGYVEAHGTGTHLGDPIEIRGLAQAFALRGGRKSRCPIGSVKSNIGHLEAASGIAGLTKVLLQMRHGELVPSLHCEVENADVGLEKTPFVVQKQLVPWASPDPGDGRNRVAAVSSFGAGGSNAHAIVEQWADPAPRPASAGQGASPEPFVISARTLPSLERYCRRLLAFLEEAPKDLADAAYTLAVGRETYGHRLALIARSQEELVASLRDAIAAGIDSAQLEDRAGRAAKQSPCPHARLGVDLSPLIARWLKGEKVDWRALYASDRSRRRISLPTYCFQRERYWIA